MNRDSQSRRGVATARRGYAAVTVIRSDVRQRGYVLLMVLAAWVLVVTTLATLADVSLRRGLAAADAERSLQQRWGSETLRRSLLPAAMGLFDRLEERAAEQPSPGRPPVWLTDRIVLGGVRFDLQLADEDAKLNLNVLHHVAGPARVERALRQTVPGAAATAIRLRPRTGPAALAREQTSLDREEESRSLEALPRAYRSWGEVFDLAVLTRRSPGSFALPSCTTGITCWGSGPLNIRRAADESILAVAASVVQDGGARRLLQRYRDRPESTLGLLLETEVSRQRDRERLSRLLSETSTNFSLWIEATTVGARPRREFTVMRRDAEGATETHRFAH